MLSYKRTKSEHQSSRKDVFLACESDFTENMLNPLAPIGQAGDGAKQAKIIENLGSVSV
jgi:hypothetical protein